MDSGAGEGSDAVLRLAERIEGASDGAWFVLVGGEHRAIVEPEGRLAAHASLVSVAEAYTRIRGSGVPASRVLVIAQGREVLEWTEAAAATGLPLFSPRMDAETSAARWQEELDTLNGVLSVLMADGGPFLDGRDCNPARVIETIRALADKGGSAVVLGMFSHGWSHPTMDVEVAVDAAASADGDREQEQEREWVLERERASAAYAELIRRVPCDLCGGGHGGDDGPTDHEHSSMATRDYYMHMPYPAPDTSWYGACTYGHMKDPLVRLYATQLTSAYAALFAADATRPVVALYNWCGSGGAAKFLVRSSYREHMGVDAWPLFLMTSSGELESSLPGLFRIWFDKLAGVIEQGAAAAESTTLASLFADVEAAYIQASPEVLDQHIVVSDACRICHEFQGTGPLVLCSVCAKLYEQDPSKYTLDAPGRRAADISAQAAAVAGGYGGRDTGGFLPSILDVPYSHQPRAISLHSPLDGTPLAETPLAELLGRYR